MALQETLENYLVEELLEEEQFLVKFDVKNSSKLRLDIFVDGDNGITIDQCASISRRLAAYIETEELITSAFNLQVSSPGVDMPLAMERQYRKNIGRTLKVHLLTEEILEGKLVEATEKGFRILSQEKKGNKVVAENEHEILYDEVKKATVKIVF